jgi:hypothetical protein
MAATCRSSPHRTAGRYGPRRSGPGREHDTTALRTHPQALPLLAEWTDEEHAARADLGYEDERASLTTPIKKTTDAPPRPSPAARGPRV